MSINLLTGDIYVILEKHPCDVLVNFVDNEGNALSQLGKKLFRFHPSFCEIVAYTRRTHSDRVLDGDYAYKVCKGKTLVAAFMERLPEEPMVGENPKMAGLFKRLSDKMLETGKQSVMLSYYGATTGVNFADFLTLCEDNFDPSLTVNVVTIERIAKYCQLPHYDYPTVAVEVDGPWVVNA